MIPFSVNKNESSKTTVIDNELTVHLNKLSGNELIHLAKAGLLHEEYVAKNYDIIKLFSDEEKQEYIKTIKTSKLACRIINEHDPKNYASLVKNADVMTMYGVQLTEEILKYIEGQELSGESREILNSLVLNTNNAYILYFVTKRLIEGNFSIEIVRDILIDIISNPYADADSLKEMITWLESLQKPLTYFDIELGVIIADNKNVTDEMLIKLLDMDIDISSSKICDKKLKKALVIKCLASNKSDVRASLAKNKTLSEDILKILTHDKNNKVSDSAKVTLDLIKLNNQENS
ncbi:MAG: hypothetical protein MJ245_02655 [Clostridia bacterium]|nr:hypothetical protein [Clostridia bacterium]